MRVAFALAATVAVISFPAGAQQNCGPTADALAMLKKDYSEAVRGRGMAAGGLLLQLLRSPDGKTWTALLSTPSGNSCIVATGEDWQDVSIPAEPQGGPEL